MHFEYTARSSIWPYEKTKVYKLTFVIKALFRLVIRLHQLKPKTVIVYTSFGAERHLIKILKSVLKYQFIIEENEYPKILNRTLKKNKIAKGIKYYSAVDGMLVISKELKTYYESIGAKNVFFLPMTVDLDRFNDEVQAIKLPYDYFIYVGGGGGLIRDGMFNMLNAFEAFQKKHPNIKFVVVGPMDLNNPNVISIQKHIVDSQLKDKVVLTGAKSSTEIPSYLAGAKGIIMTPQEDYPSGGFPTKLGEFLASGKAVITTNVSELPDYLNNKNAFIFPPGDDALIEKAMLDVIKDEENAKLIGKAGRETAIEHFNIKSHINDLILFLNI